MTDTRATPESTNSRESPVAPETARAGPRRLAILGSTGSIGTQALDVVRDRPGEYEVVALAAGSNAEMLEAQRLEFGVPEDRALLCADRPELLAELASLAEVEVVLNGVVGFAGLPVTLAALEHGKRLGLANKESLIAAGPVVAKARAAGGGEIVPVDSEHSAIYQALRAGRMSEVRTILLTASGGPFRGRTRAELEHVTIADALQHPTWSMGAKITIDSSTLMNKGLEVIEAHELFDVPIDTVDVVVHPQSVVHGMVEFCDGAVIAQLSMPDMKLPIGLALGAPARHPVAYGPIDWRTLGTLTFEPPDREVFPCLDLAYGAGRAGGSAPATLSAANEVAVEAFLAGALPWVAIAEIVSEVLQAGTGNVDDLGDVLEADRVARARARTALERRNAA
ncbi:MAG: 1-deoxy-D-xylulose 5-phosphate reductoisomerase [Actinomycetia bacterium]|nr:1-deoxy-D-xylulose 5-phosphate reductoisomerase [Actinomycetes bacterium]